MVQRHANEVMRSITRSLKPKRTRTVDVQTFDQQQGNQRSSIRRSKCIPQSILLPSTASSCSFVAQFHPDEIIAGNILDIGSTERHGKHKNKTQTTFQFQDVIGIRVSDLNLDPTESMSDDYSEDNFVNEYHDQDNDDDDDDETIQTISDCDLARDIVRMQASEMASEQQDEEDGKFFMTKKKPLHKYMIKRVHHKSSNPQDAVNHLVQETAILKQWSHGHHNLISLWGIPTDDYSREYKCCFVLTDRISETLAKRINRWRHEDGVLPCDNKPKGMARFFSKQPKTKTLPIVHSKALVDPFHPHFRQKVVYAQNLASVLSFLHSKHIIVRNLHPESIGFLASDDTLQLMDLGQAINTSKFNDNETIHQYQRHDAATLLQQQLEHSLFQMTPGQVYRYIAPEVLTTLHPKEGTSTTAPSLPYGQQVDTYSWAMISLELWTLSKPFAAMQAGQHLRQVCLQKAKARPHLDAFDLPKPLERLLQRSWHDKPQRRPEMAKVDAALLEFLQTTQL